MSRLSRDAKKAALLAAAIVAVALGASAAIEIENRPYTGYRVNAEGKVLGVDHHGPGAAAGLRVGDVIRKLNGHPATNGEKLQEQLRHAQAAGPLSLEADRNGQTVLLEIAPARLPARELRLARTRSLLGLVFLAFPFWAWFRAPDSPARLLAVFGLSFGFLLMGAPSFESPGVRIVLNGVAIFALYIGLPALVHFLLAFPSRKQFLDRWWALVVLYGPALMVALMTVAALNLPIAIVSHNVLGMSSLLVSALYFLSAIALLIWRYVAASRADRARHGLALMLLGALATFVPLLLYPVVTSLWPGSVRYYQVIASTYSPPLTLALIPIAFSAAAVRSARAERQDVVPAG